MRRLMTKMTTALLLGAVTLTLTPQSAKADQYFDPFGFSNPGDFFFSPPPDIFFPAPYLLPDLIIEDVVIPSHTDKIAYIKVRNIGLAIADPSHITAHNGSGMGIGDTPSLDINQYRWCLLSMNPGASLSACSSITVFKTDAFREVAELNENNNTKIAMCN